MDIDEETNLLRRLFEGERIDRNLLDVIEENIYTRGFNVFISNDIEDIKVVYVHPYLFRLLKEKEEDINDIRVTRYDKPSIFLNHMIIKEDPTLPNYDYLVLHKEDIKSLYSSAMVNGKFLNFRPKLVFGMKSKVFKDSSLNSSYMEREEISILKIHKMVRKYLAEAERFLFGLEDESEVYREEEWGETIRRTEEIGRYLENAIEYITRFSNLFTKSEIEETKRRLWELTGELWSLSSYIRNDPLPDTETIKWYDDIGREEVVLHDLIGYMFNYENERWDLKRRKMKIGVKVGEDGIDLGMLSIVYRNDLKPYAIGLSRCIGEEYGLLGKTGIPVFFYDEYGEEKPIKHPKLKVSSKRIQLEEKAPEKVVKKGALPEIGKKPKEVPRKKEVPIKPTETPIKPKAKEEVHKVTTRKKEPKAKARPRKKVKKEHKLVGTFNIEGSFSGTFKGTVSPN